MRSLSFPAFKSAPPLARGPALQALYDELAARDRELARLRAGLRGFALDADPARSSGERRPFDLLAAVEAALRACQTELSGVIVCLHVLPLAVHASLAGTTQVLVHLLANAAAAMQDTGRPGVVHIDAAQRGMRVRVRVSDNGRGIAPAVLPHLFEPFFSTGGKGMGLGLGLTVSGAIVRAHGGQLSCSNRRPHGARFVFDLPGAAGLLRRAPARVPVAAACAGAAAPGAGEALAAAVAAGVGAAK